MALEVELFLDGTWTSPPRIRYESGVEIERGRDAEANYSSSMLTFVGDNRDLWWSSDVPGTTNYGLMRRGTPIRVRDTQITDSFTRTASSSWGTCETPAVPWEIGAGSASDYSVTSGAGRHTLTTTTTSRQTRIELDLRASMVVCSVTIGATATGASAYASIVARKNAINTNAGTRHYRAQLEFDAGGNVTASIIRLTGPGGDVSIATPVVVGTYSGGSKWWLQFTCVGQQLYLKAWPDGQSEPTTYTTTAEDAHLRKGQVALQSARNASNTNSNLTFDFDDLEVSEPRFHGEIWSLRPMSDRSGRDLTMTVEASGLFRRLSNTAKPIRSPLYRGFVLGVIDGDQPPVAYFPLEDGNDATQLEVYGDGTRPGHFSDGVSTGSDSSLAGSDALPTASDGGVLGGLIPAFPSDFDASTDFWSLNFLVKIDDVPESEAVIAQFGTNTEAACYEIAMDTTGALILRTPKLQRLLVDPYVFTTSAAYDSPVEPGEPSLFGRWVSMTLTNTPGGGANYLVSLSWRDAVQPNTQSTLSSPSGTTVWLPPAGPWQLFGPPGGSSSFGHVVAHAQLFTLFGYEPGGYVGETARDRFSRLAAEENVAVQTLGTGAEPMGPQLLDTLVGNLEDCQSTDLGIARESRHVLGLEFYSHEHRYNQMPAATLDIAGGTIAEGLDPVRDDQNVATSVTATRAGGTPQMFTVPADDVFHLTSGEEAGPGIEPVGLVEASISPNVENDRRAHNQASWHAHLRATKDPRFEELTVNLSAPTYRADPQLAFDVAGLVEGDVLRLTNPPSWMHPSHVELQVQGIREYTCVKETPSGAKETVRELTFNLTPGRPWGVWCMDARGSRIEAAADDDETSLKVSVELGPAWKTSPDPGWAIQGMTGGEAMLVTGCTTDTPAFIAAGTVATANNASVVPGLPAGMTADTGQLMLMFAAIRNSGTGTVNTPSGWTVLAQVSPQRNVTVFGRYYVTGDAAPTVSFTSGVAGADTMARIFGFSGVSHRYGGAGSATKAAKRAPGAALQLNSSAQDIAYPAYYVHRNNSVVLIFAWKQDDWTGVAPPAGFTEMGDNATTTGDDSGIAAYYQIQTTATNITAGSLVVTGGAAAISRSIVVALRPLQTLVVERAINGVSGSLAATESLHVYNHGAVGL